LTFHPAQDVINRMRLVVIGLAMVVCAAIGLAAQQPSARAENVIVITMDGLRWQELFGGLSADYLTREAGGVEDRAEIESRFAAATAPERRRRLMPFFWTVIATQGQVFGDPGAESIVRVTNERRVSYPGYAEMLTGFADPRIANNDKIANPNATVLEWLNKRPSFAGRVAAFASWELLPWIVNEERSGIPSNGQGSPVAEPATDRERLINDFASELPPYWGATRFDAPTAFGALEYLRTRKPRVLYVMLGETDEWAHQRRYDLYLDAAWRNDRMIRRFWEAAQAIPEYSGRTALLLTTDHGRGDSAEDWVRHGRETPASDRIWIAAMGPGVPALGVRRGVNATQSQLAATIAALLGEDYTREEPKAAAALDLRR
jgi:hypothetical protein